MGIKKKVKKGDSLLLCQVKEAAAGKCLPVCKPAWGIYRKIQDLGGFQRNLVRAANPVGLVIKVVS